MNGRRGVSGMPLVEMVVSTIFIAVVIAILMNRLLYYHEVAEKASMELQVQSIRAGLRLEMARRLVGGKGRSIAELVDANPMVFLEKPPGNYVGTVSTLDVERVARGSWVFDQVDKCLIYVPKLSGHLVAETKNKVVFVRFRLKLTQDYPKILGNPDILPEVQFVTARPYQWFQPSSLSDLSDRSEPSRKSRADLSVFEAHSGPMQRENGQIWTDSPAGAADQPQVRQAASPHR